MTCTPFKIGNFVGMLCARGPLKKKERCGCGRVATLLCDFPVGDSTCDKPLCEACAIHAGKDKDYCRTHPVRPDHDADLFSDIDRVEATCKSSSGLCMAPHDARSVASCIWCGKELRERAGRWFRQDAPEDGGEPQLQQAVPGTFAL